MTFYLARRSASALVIMLACIVIISILLIAYLSEMQLDRIATQNYSQGIKTQEIAFGAFEEILGDLTQEIDAGSLADPGFIVGTNRVFFPSTNAAAMPARIGFAPADYANDVSADKLPPSFIRASRAEDPFYTSPPAWYDASKLPPNRASAVSTALASANRRTFNPKKWNKPRLLGADVPTVFSASPPDWVYVTRSGSRVCGPDELAILKPDGKVRGQLFYRPTVTGAIVLQMLPVPPVQGQDAAVKLIVQNNSAEKQEIEWEVALTGEQRLIAGKFSDVEPTRTFFKDAASGSMELAARKSGEIVLPLADADPFKVYRAKAMVKDASGRTAVQERPLSAFYGVPKTAKPVSIDGDLADEAWKKAPLARLDQADQFFAFILAGKPVPDWKSPEDLSADIRYLWDEDFLYVGVRVADDIRSKTLQQDNALWMQDSLQFLVDPMRTSERKIGKYEYSLADGKKGPQVWCTLTADAGAPAGEAKDIRLAVKHDAGGSSYEVAIPWSRLAPFRPAPGADLGFTLIVNDDDGAGRDSFMTWFGNAHTKDVDTVGDLILLENEP